MKATSYNNQKIAVLGAGESGESAAVLLSKLGAVVTVLDSGDPQKLQAKRESLAAKGIKLIAGPEADTDAASYDLAVLSPGIDPIVPLVKNIVAREIPMTGELELAYGVCECPIIGITGTNGKTTTTQLVEKMLRECGVRTLAAGNIGPAFSARVLESNSLDVMTLEISSFQLETIRDFRPTIALWLNFAPDHLDRYTSMEEYYAAKLRIFENQTDGDWAIVNFRDRLPSLKAQQVTFSAFAIGGDFDFVEGVIRFRGKPVLRLSDTQLRGAHNAENLMAAMGTGFAYGLSFEQMVGPLSAYRALPHRCELIRVVNGVEWVNDSKGTNLDSVEKALMSESKPVVLIAGGKDKGFEYDSLSELVGAKCRSVVVMGEMADRIEAMWKDRVPCSNAGRSLSRAVELAAAKAQPGDVVLFSPGTSSFDMFRNYADRGNQFRELVQNLAPSTP